MDYLVRGMTEDGEFRFAAVRSTDLANEARRRHDTKSGASKILAETMTATLLVGAHLEKGQRLSLQLTCNGPVRSVMADATVVPADDEAQEAIAEQVRGFIANPQVYAELDEAPGGPPPFGTEGELVGLRSTRTQILYRGAVPLTAGDVAADVANYLSRSEQVQSVMVLGSALGEDRALAHATGILLQSLPGASPEKFAEYERVLEDPMLRARIAAEPTPEAAVETLMNAVMHESPYKILTRVDVAFRCDCSREKVADMIRMLGKDEIGKMMSEQGQAEVTCRFCNEVYLLDNAELGVILHTIGTKEN